MLFFSNNKTRRNCPPTTIINRNRCLNMLTRPSSVSILLRLLFFHTQRPTYKRTYRMQKDNDTCVFILSSLPIRQQASHTACSKHSLSRSFYAFALILLPSSFASHIFFAFATTISNHILCIAMLFLVSMSLYIF